MWSKELFRMIVESRAARHQRVPGATIPPFGVEANRKALQMAIDWSLEQKMIPRRLAVDEPVRRRDPQARLTMRRLARHRALGRDELRAGACAGLAQNDFPNRPVRIIVPFPAGGPTDVDMRILGQKLAEIWDQGVVIENRPGANTGIGAQVRGEGRAGWLHAARRDGHDTGDESGDRRVR